MTIALYARSTKDNHAGYIEQIHQYLADEGVELIIHDVFYNHLRSEGLQLEFDTYSTSEGLISRAFYLICLGGDGTMLETVTLVRKSGIPILGVNTGRLGFLASVNKDDLLKALRQLLTEKYTLDKRELITISGCPECFGNSNYALN